MAQSYQTGKLSQASILYSTDSGLSWKNANYETPHLSSRLTGVTVSSNGVPYFTGVAEDQSKIKQSFVLTLENEKAVLLTSFVNRELKQVTAFATGQYFVVGSDLSAESPMWFLASGFNDGVSVDRDLDLALLPRLGQTAGSADFVTSVGKNIYMGSTVSDSKSWVITKTNGSKPLVIVDQFNGHYAKVSLGGLFIFHGLPFAFGGVQDSDKRSHWIIRYAEFDDRFQTLTTLNQDTEADISAKAVGMATLGGNNQLAVIGRGHDSQTGYHWRLVRFLEHPFTDRH